MADPEKKTKNKADSQGSGEDTKLTPSKTQAGQSESCCITGTVIYTSPEFSELENTVESCTPCKAGETCTKPEGFPGI